MRYRTKEWFELSQKTDLHYGLRAHKDAVSENESVYIRLYKRKEKEFIKSQMESYDFDPRFMLNLDNTVFVKADKFLKGDELNDEDTIINEMETKQKDDIYQLIEDYDGRQSFDVESCKMEFAQNQNYSQTDLINRIPSEIYTQIADPRVFALGYCTKEILSQLKKISYVNEKRIQHVQSEYFRAQIKEDIPEELLSNFGFHDCKVLSIVKNNDIVVSFDMSGGFSKHNKLIFHDAKIIYEDKNIEGSYWIYEELYKTQNGYEAHMLLSSSESNQDLIVSCRDITFGRD